MMYDMAGAVECYHGGFSALCWLHHGLASLLEKPQKNRAWRRRRLHAPRKKTPITGAEAKVYAT